MDRKRRRGKMICTTTDLIDSQRPYEVIGLVTAHSVRSRNAFSKMGASFKSSFGGHIGSFEKLYDMLKDDAMTELTENATKLGADAIVAIRMEFVELPDTESASLHVYVTTVRIINK